MRMKEGKRTKCFFQIIRRHMIRNGLWLKLWEGEVSFKETEGSVRKDSGFDYICGEGR